MDHICETCDEKFHTKEGLDLHHKVSHKKKKKPAKKPIPKGSIVKEGYLDPTGTFLIGYMPDGKSKTMAQYVKRMRQEYPTFKVGDKIPTKEVRKLFKHHLTMKTKIKGGKLVVKEIRLAKNGITHYTLESGTMILKWYEGEPFKHNKKSKVTNHHYISEPKILKKKK